MLCCESLLNTLIKLDVKNELHWNHTNPSKLLRFGLPTTVTRKTTVFWDVTPCSLVEVAGRFGETFIVHHHGRSMTVSHLMCICCAMCVLLFFTLDAGLLAIIQYSEGPATGHLDKGFSWFPRVYKQMLRWFPRFQVATTCFSFSPPDLTSVVTILYTCKITTATG